MTHEPFDPSDPADLLADTFRREVAAMAQRIFDKEAFRGLTPIQQVESFMAGVTTGLVGVCFAHVEEAGHNGMMDVIAKYLPIAREQAEGIMEDAALN